MDFNKYFSLKIKCLSLLTALVCFLLSNTTIINAADYFGSGGNLGSGGFGWSSGWSSGIFGNIGSSSFSAYGGGGGGEEGMNAFLAQLWADLQLVDQFFQGDLANSTEFFDELVAYLQTEANTYAATDPQYADLATQLANLTGEQLQAMYAESGKNQTGLAQASDELKNALQAGTQTSTSEEVGSYEYYYNLYKEAGVTNEEMLVSLAQDAVAKNTKMSESQNLIQSGSEITTSPDLNDYIKAEELINSYNNWSGSKDSQKLITALESLGFKYYNGILYEKLTLDGAGNVIPSESYPAIGSKYPLAAKDINDKLARALSPCLESYDLGLPEGDGEGEDNETTTTTTTTSTTCTSYTYSDWGACVAGTQTRTIQSQSPSGCTNTSSAVLEQNCTASAIVCTSYTYSDWGACVAGTQTRTIQSQSPSGCTDTSSAVLEQNCTVGETACTSYTYSDWGACVAGTQTRTIQSQSPSGCTDTSSAVLEQNCTVGETACTSYTYSDWSVCVGGTQTRTILEKFPSGCTDTSTAVFTQTCTVSEPPIVTSATNDTYYVPNPVLSVITDRPATCQYNENGGFAYPEGTTFDTTGFYNHNAQLPDASNGDKVYYAVCRDNATGGVSDALEIKFTIDVNTAPIVSNTTPVNQTGDDPVLSVTTDVPAACQYSQAEGFAYGSGITLPSADSYAHGISISTLADGDYVFYAVCKNNDTGAISAARQIDTTLDRSENNTEAPVITNNTNSYQTVDSPVLLISTDKAAICQYGSESFDYGNGTQFAITGTTSHSTQLSNLADGQHAYYIICQAVDNGVASNPGYQIIFTVDAGEITESCAGLSSNDRKNDDDRSNNGVVGGDSLYMWQSVETGTRERFSQVDWYAGYQFTTEKDGRITELCGYFEDGTTNKVSLYNGSYSELASAEITGNGGWECAAVGSAEISADNRYYIIARVKDNPIYFEYRSGMLPRESGHAIIEAGIRQTIVDGIFKTDIIKYDYMVFGLVDAKITFADDYATGPQIVIDGPSGTVYDISPALEIQTEIGAICRFDREDVDYDDMSYVFGNVADGNYRQKICNLEEGNFTFYARCENASGVENNQSTVIQFDVSQ